MTSEMSPDHQNRAPLGGGDTVSDGVGGANWSATLTDLHAHAMKHKSVRDQSPEVIHRQAAGLLAKVVEGHVIPRLVLAHRNETPDANTDTAVKASGTGTLSPADIADFTDLLLKGQSEDVENYVSTLLQQGHSGKDLYLDLLAPTARLLGVYWEDDKCSFTDVTIGLGRLQSLLYRLSAQNTRQGGMNGIAPKALFLTPEGAQHSFGVRMAEDLFRQAGWNTICELSASLSTIKDRVSNEAFDMVGISLSVQEHVDQARELVEQIRLNSRNQGVRIMVGGQLVTNNPELVQKLGVDSAARDGMEAMALAVELGYGKST